MAAENQIPIDEIKAAAKAIKGWKAAWKSWLQTRTEQLFTEEDVDRGHRLFFWHDENMPYPVRRAQVLAKACDRLAKQGMQAGLDVRPALQLARDLRRRSYSELAVLDGTETLAEELELRIRIWTSNTGTETGSTSPPPRAANLDETSKCVIALLKREGRSVKLNDLKVLVRNASGYVSEDSVFRKRLRRLKALGEIDGNGRGLYWHPSASEGGR